MTRLALLLLACVALPAWADERGEPAVIDAQQLSFQQGLAVGEGDVLIRYKGAVMRADRVRFKQDTKEAWADGNVRLNRDGMEWVAPAIYYNFDTHALKIAEARGFFDPVIVRGHDISLTGSNKYSVARATFTTCDYEQPHYRIEATRSEYWPGDRMLLYNVTVRLGNVPVLWVPVMAWSLKGDMPPVAVSLGNTSRWGFFVLTTTTFPLNQNSTLAVHVDGRTNRGMAGGADLKYRLGNLGEGLLRGYYINDADAEDKLDTLAGKDLRSNRYRVGWQHKAIDVRPGWDVTVDLNKQSDSDVAQDFFVREFRLELEPQSVADVTKRGDNFTVSVLTRPQLNDFFAEVERLPEATWAVNRMRLGQTPLYYESVSSAGYLDNHQGETMDPVFAGDSFRAHTYHQLVAPGLWFGWLSVVPRAGIGGTYYSDSPDGAAEQRMLYNAGVEASLKLTRTWKNVRHVMQPFADYQWVPRSDNRTNEVFQFDTVRTTMLGGGDLLSLTRYSPVGFPAFNTVDAIDRQHFVRFGLRQQLQTRREGQSWNLVELEGWTDWRVQRDAGEHAFSDVFGTLRVRPNNRVVFDGFGRYDTQDGVMREVNAEARVFDTDRWSVGVGNRYLRDDSHLFALSVAVRLNRHWVAQTYHRVDFNDGVWESQEYMLRQETHDWLISYGVRLSDERVKGNEFAVFMAVTLKAFPRVGLNVHGMDLGSY